MGISDVTPYDTIEDAAQGMLTGDAILFVDGYGHALKIADKGYPGMGVQEPDSEKVIRGSKEGFTDSIKTNTALIRKRVRSTRVKVEEVQEGVRSHTAIDLVYMADLKYTSVLEKIREKITEYEIDGVMDSGILEQLAEKKWYSPFPQFQTTQRPDRAALAVLEGNGCTDLALHGSFFCHDASRTVSGGDKFSHTDSADTAFVILLGGTDRCAFSGGTGGHSHGDFF